MPWSDPYREAALALRQVQRLAPEDEKLRVGDLLASIESVLSHGDRHSMGRDPS